MHIILISPRLKAWKILNSGLTKQISNIFLSKSQGLAQYVVKEEIYDTVIRECLLLKTKTRAIAFFYPLAVT